MVKHKGCGWHKHSLEHAKAAMKGHLLKRGYSQTGVSNKAADRQRKAMAPGKRMSRAGKVYWEKRRNRSDLLSFRKL